MALFSSPDRRYGRGEEHEGLSSVGQGELHIKRPQIFNTTCQHQLKSLCSRYIVHWYMHIFRSVTAEAWCLHWVKVKEQAVLSLDSLLTAFGLYKCTHNAAGPGWLGREGDLHVSTLSGMPCCWWQKHKFQLKKKSYLEGNSSCGTLNSNVSSNSGNRVPLTTWSWAQWYLLAMRDLSHCLLLQTMVDYITCKLQ